MGRVDIGRIDAVALDRVDVLKHALDAWPAIGPQQNLAARTHERKRLERLAASDRAHDVDARDDRAVVIGGPADEGKDAVRREADDAAVAIEDLLIALAAEPDPMLDLPLSPGQIDERGERRRPGRLRSACRMAASLIGQMGQARIAGLGQGLVHAGHASLRSLVASVERSRCTHASDWVWRASLMDAL